MMRYLIVGQYASNKGDRAIAEYIVFSLLQEGVTDITLSTTQPKLWKNIFPKNVKIIRSGIPYFGLLKIKIIKKAYYKVIKVIIRRFFYKSVFNDKNGLTPLLISNKLIQSIKLSDHVILTGGHHITTLREKDAIYEVTYDVALMHQHAKKFSIWSQTIGPLQFENIIAKEWFRKVFERANSIYLRDNKSFDILNHQFGNPFVNLKRTEDTVFGFSKLLDGEVERSKEVAVSIFNGLPKAFNTFPVIAKLLDYIAIKGYKIIFFKMEHGDTETSHIERIISLMAIKTDYEIYPFETSTITHMNRLKKCSLSIGYKTHSVIMSLTANVPTLAISYHPKTEYFMSLFGQDKSCFDDENLNIDRLTETIDYLINNELQITNTLQTRSSQICEIVDHSFIDMLRS